MSTTTFQPIHLGFNENGFNTKIHNLQSGIAADINAAIKEIQELGLKPTDAQLRAIFQDQDPNPDDFLGKHFNKVASKFERERNIAEYCNEIDLIRHRASQGTDFQREIYFIHFSKGKAEISEAAKETFKKEFSQTLNSARAKELHDLYQAAFEANQSLLSKMNETGMVHFHHLFSLDSNWNLQTKNFDFNKL